MPPINYPFYIALVAQHQQAFKQEVMQAFAAKHSMSMEQVAEEHEEVIERDIQFKKNTKA